VYGYRLPEPGGANLNGVCGSDCKANMFWLNIFEML